jgi:hypothetical protein
VSACYIAGISGQTASGGMAVFIDANGKLGTVTSSARFKGDIQPMDSVSGAMNIFESPLTCELNAEWRVGWTKAPNPSSRSSQ